jgi:immunity protein 22 of polymorphic toxin system
METVHVFVSTGRFRSFQEMRAFIDQTYTEDGDGVPSAFMREVGLSSYEPGCIEAIHREQVVALSQLLARASYGDQWVPQLDGSLRADAAICVFAPNAVAHPHRSSLEYVGAFEYRAVCPE